MSLSPRDRKFGAKGDGFADDGKALIKWLQALKDTGQEGFVDRLYLSSVPLSFHAGLKIVGTHPAFAGIGAHPSMPIGAQLIVAHATDGLQLYDLGFVGSTERRNEPPASAMIDVIGVDDAVFYGCRFARWRHLIAFSACKRVTWERCEFSDWGTIEDVPNIGQCLYDGGYGLLAVNVPSDDIRILGCSFHDGSWHPIAASGRGWLIADCETTRTMEGALFGGLIDSTITRNRFMADRQRDCTSNGMEFGGRGLQISYNIMGEFDQACIRLGDPRDTAIVHNTLYNPEQLAPVGVAPGGEGCIVIVSNTGVDGLTIEGNRCRDTSGRASHAIALHNWGGQFSNTTIGGNDCRGPWKGAAVLESGDVRGVGFKLAA